MFYWYEINNSLPSMLFSYSSI